MPELSALANRVRQHGTPAMAATIYLHWAASPYTWLRSGLYHSIISGEGRVQRLHSYAVELPAHTWRRNNNAVVLSCACMGGRPDRWSIPPTRSQLEALCQEAAAIAHSWSWDANAITIQRLMTHAEAASNRDGRQPHNNYGPVIWGGSGKRVRGRRPKWAPKSMPLIELK